MTSRIGLTPNNKSRCGFTLIEILLVLVVLSVVIGITVPNFRNTYQKFIFKKSVDDVAYAMRYAQSRAVMKNVVTRLEFSDDFSQYWLMQQEEKEGSDDAGTFDHITGQMGKIFTMDPAVKIESREKTVDFYPDGNIDQRELKMCSRDECYGIATNRQRGYVSTYSIDPLTGQEFHAH